MYELVTGLIIVLWLLGFSATLYVKILVNIIVDSDDDYSDLRHTLSDATQPRVFIYIFILWPFLILQILLPNKV